jgi:hypothetical protein
MIARSKRLKSRTNRTLSWDFESPYRKETADLSTALPPDFLFSVVALMEFVRLSLRRSASVVVAGSAREEIRVRFGRDDKFVARRFCCRDVNPLC